MTTTIGTNATANTPTTGRFKDCMLVGGILLLVAATLPLLGIFALVARGVVFGLALVALVAGLVVLTASPHCRHRFGEWLDRQSQPDDAP